jgi:hypothetical protein
MEGVQGAVDERKMGFLKPEQGQQILYRRTNSVTDDPWWEVGNKDGNKVPARALTLGGGQGQVLCSLFCVVL